MRHRICAVVTNSVEPHRVGALAHKRTSQCPELELIMPAIDLGKFLPDHRAMSHACLEACVECLVACEMCADACLEEADSKTLTTCIRLDRDCAEACAAAVRVMARGGPLTAELCHACARACDACAAECDKHAAHHEHCRLCAEACRRCADECRRMAGR